MPDWDKALDARSDLLRWLFSQDGEKALMSALNFRYDDERDYRSEEYGQTSAQLMASTVALAEPIWVTNDITRLVETISESFRAEPILPSDVMVPSGFAYFERHLPWLDREFPDLDQHYQAACWFVGPYNEHEDAVYISLWTHADDLDDERKVNWMIGHNLVPVAQAIMGLETYNNEGIMFRHLQVLWRLAQQKIVLSGPQPVSRAARRRAAKWHEVRAVNVLTLRRQAHKQPETESEVDWSHRWLVNGHWRDQWFPSIKAHRQIWIAPYVKGPDDKPFVPKQRVIDFSR